MHTWALPLMCFFLGDIEAINVTTEASFDGYESTCDDSEGLQYFSYFS